MPKINNDKSDSSLDNSNQDVDSGPISEQLNSDNAFSDSGLVNESLLRETCERGNSKKKIVK